MVGGLRFFPGRDCFDNHVLVDENSIPIYKHIEVHPIAAAMGAEIRGVDLKSMTEEQVREIKQALFHHKMVFFKDQKISHADHAAFSLHFGDYAEDAYTKGIEGHPHVQPVIMEANDKSKYIFGSGWHMDSPIIEHPPALTILRSVEVPPFGGDTQWCNTALAYKTLSKRYREMIRDLQVNFSLREVIKSAHQMTDSAEGTAFNVFAKTASTPEDKLDEAFKAKRRGCPHPMVVKHPVSGEEALYVDQEYATGIVGMTEDESTPILAYLGSHITQAAFSCRLRWEPDMVAMWDNRLCVHQGFNDFCGYRREFYRTTIAGELSK